MRSHLELYSVVLLTSKLHLVSCNFLPGKLSVQDDNPKDFGVTTYIQMWTAFQFIKRKEEKKDTSRVKALAFSVISMKLTFQLDFLASVYHWLTSQMLSLAKWLLKNILPSSNFVE